MLETIPILMKRLKIYREYDSSGVIYIYDSK